MQYIDDQIAKESDLFALKIKVLLRIKSTDWRNIERGYPVIYIHDLDKLFDKTQTFKSSFLRFRKGEIILTDGSSSFDKEFVLLEKDYNELILGAKNEE
jgi:predicted alpha/beta superfamily hydrolase